MWGLLPSDITSLHFLLALMKPRLRALPLACTTPHRLRGSGVPISTCQLAHKMGHPTGGRAGFGALCLLSRFAFDGIGDRAAQNCPRAGLPPSRDKRRAREIQKTDQS